MKGNGFLSKSSVQLHKGLGLERRSFQRNKDQLTVRARSTPSIANHLRSYTQIRLKVGGNITGVRNVPMTITKGRCAELNKPKSCLAHNLNLCAYVSQSIADTSLTVLFPSSRSCHVGLRSVINMLPSPGRASRIMDFHTEAFS